MAGASRAKGDWLRGETGHQETPEHVRPGACPAFGRCASRTRGQAPSQHAGRQCNRSSATEPVPVSLRLDCSGEPARFDEKLGDHIAGLEWKASRDRASFGHAARVFWVRSFEPNFCARNRRNLPTAITLPRFSRWLRSRWIRMNFARSRACSRGFSGDEWRGEKWCRF